MTAVPPFVSAPGKVMLFGEYAVLDGHEALLVAVDRYIETRFEPSDGLSIDAAPFGTYPSTTEHDRLPFVEAVLREFAPRDCRFKIRARGFEVNGQKLGLGSSAASTVSFIGAAMSAMGRPLDHSEVFRIAQNSHHSVQGLGSGADIATSVYGGAIRYAWRKDAHAGAEHCVETEVGTGHITQIGTGLESILTVWTGRPASTRALVTAMHIHRQSSDYVDFMARLGAAAVEGAGAWQSAQRRQLIDVMSSCADLLKSMTRRFDTAIWTPAHDMIEEIVGQRGAIKPTGAGGGDLAWVLGTTQADDDLLESELKAAGYPCYRFMVSPHGVHLQT